MGSVNEGRRYIVTSSLIGWAYTPMNMHMVLGLLLVDLIEPCKGNFTKTWYPGSSEPKRSWLNALQWRHNEYGGVSNHRRLDCLLNHLFRCKSKKTSEVRVTGLCEGNSPVTGEFPAQRASNRKMFPFDDVIVVSRTGADDMATTKLSTTNRCVYLIYDIRYMKSTT